MTGVHREVDVIDTPKFVAMCQYPSLLSWDSCVVLSVLQLLKTWGVGGTNVACCQLFCCPNVSQFLTNIPHFFVSLKISLFGMFFKFPNYSFFENFGIFSISSVWQVSKFVNFQKFLNSQRFPIVKFFKFFAFSKKLQHFSIFKNFQLSNFSFSKVFQFKKYEMFSFSPFWV